MKKISVATITFFFICSMFAFACSNDDGAPSAGYKPSDEMNKRLKGEPEEDAGEQDAGADDDDDNDDNDDDTAPGKWVEREYIFRAISGVSMGAGGGLMIGARNHRMFDIISGLGGIGDMIYLYHMIDRQSMNGFCDMEDIIADPNTFCGPIPGEQEHEWTQDYNNWVYSDNGGNFDRRSYVDIFEDLSMAFGNPLLATDHNNYLPKGVTPDWAEMPAADRCANPLVIPNYFHHKYNPEGTFNAVTFCEGGNRTGVYDPDGDNSTSVVIMLAIDYNDNGKRDYGEPVLLASREPWQDYGCDGVKGGEDEYLPRDKSNHPGYLNNPEGADNNWIWDECEPFDDYGLDGVPNTGDYGEGDGEYTMSAALQNALEHNPRTLASRWTDEEFARIDWYMDAGIRDLFNFAISMDQLAAYINWRNGDMAVINDFDNLIPEGQKDYDFKRINFDNYGKSMYVRYGDPDATEDYILDGDGAHVGTSAQAVNRFNTFFAYLSSRWPDGDYEKYSGDLRGLTLNTKFYSKSLKSERPITLILPPGYFDEENKDKYYPSLYFGHGYGMDPEGLASTAAIFLNYQKSGFLQKMIIVYTDGQCCFMHEETEEINCLGKDDKGEELKRIPGWKRMCHRGNFYVNQFGKIRDEYPLMKYEDSILDAIEWVDATYRTKASQGHKKIKVLRDKPYSPDERPGRK